MKIITRHYLSLNKRGMEKDQRKSTDDSVRPVGLVSLFLERREEGLLVSTTELLQYLGGA
jgi:hypothetical protein